MDQALKNADTLLVSVMGGPDMTMAHVNDLMRHINQDAPKAKVVMGAALDESFRDRLAVTVFAMRHTQPVAEKDSLPDGDLPEFDTELMHKKADERPASRTVPPAPALTLNQREALVAKSGLKGSRGRKTASKLKQGTLPLDIVNRGRFDKTEATIRNGEDLDLPTFMRKGVKLN
jgi:cell division protein FtsZ